MKQAPLSGVVTVEPTEGGGFVEPRALIAEMLPVIVMPQNVIGGGNRLRSPLFIDLTELLDVSHLLHLQVARRYAGGASSGTRPRIFDSAGAAAGSFTIIGAVR